MSYNNELASNMKANCAKQTAKDNDALYARIKRGDEAAREEMITNNMPLVTTVVHQYLANRRYLEYLRDDLVGEGFVALTKIVNSLVTKEIERPTDYLGQSIKYAISHTLHRLADEPREISDDLGLDTTGEIDAIDELEAACQSDMDHRLIELRREGLTFHEIAEELNKPFSFVQRSFAQIRDRFERREKLLSI